MGNTSMSKAGPEDVKDISRIHAQSWKTAYKGIVPQPYLDDLKDDSSVGPLSEWMQNGVLEFLLARDADQGEAMGCISYGPARDEAFEGYGEIISIYLMPEQLGTGLGQKLLQKGLESLEKAGYTDVYLWVLKENGRTRRFYEKNGFTCNGDEHIVTIMDQDLINVRYVLSENMARKR